MLYGAASSSVVKYDSLWASPTTAIYNTWLDESFVAKQVAQSSKNPCMISKEAVK